MNNNGLPAFLLLLIASGLSGCATMSGDECLTSDWHAIGFEDGSRGYDANRLGNHRKACAKHGVTPDFASYQAGHDEGLGRYCQPSRGFNVGSAGGSYNGVCATHREREFVDAYNSGYHLYQLRGRVSSAKSQIHNKKQALEENEELMKDKGVILIAADTPTEDRVRIVIDLNELAESNGKLKAEIEQLLENRAHHEHELADYEAVLANSGY